MYKGHSNLSSLLGIKKRWEFLIEFLKHAGLIGERDRDGGRRLLPRLAVDLHGEALAQLDGHLPGLADAERLRQAHLQLRYVERGIYTEYFQ